MKGALPILPIEILNEFNQSTGRRGGELLKKKGCLLFNKRKQNNFVTEQRNNLAIPVKQMLMVC